MFDCDIIVSNNKYKLKKADIFLLLIIFAAALIILLIMQLQRSEGSYASVLYDNGELLISIPLEQSNSRYFLLTYESQASGDFDSNGVHIDEYSEEEWSVQQMPSVEYNAFLYKDNEIQMISSSCPDNICVHHKAISMTGENIICLPHKLVIEISGGEEADLNGVAY